MTKRSPEPDQYADIRESVRALCVKFPGDYWRALDRERAYPTKFVAALTEAGYLAALIPEEFGGSGLGIGAAAAILEEVEHVAVDPQHHRFFHARWGGGRSPRRACDRFGRHRLEGFLGRGARVGLAPRLRRIAPISRSVSRIVPSHSLILARAKA